MFNFKVLVFSYFWIIVDFDIDCSVNDANPATGLKTAA